VRSHANLLDEQDEDEDIKEDGGDADTAGKMYFKSVESGWQVIMHEGGIVEDSFDDEEAKEHEDIADTRSASILALSSFNGS
jgi:hypothetical protein